MEIAVDSLAHGIRLMLGLGMVAAGTALVAPAALQVAAWLAAPAASVDTVDTVDTVATVATVQPPQFLPGQATWHPLPASPSAVPHLPSAGFAQLEYVPPPTPPQAMPSVSPALAAPGPQLGMAYRSTLQAPPPPLLDGQTPPPFAVGWTARGAGVRPPSAVGTEPSGVYVVRDGDDLTGLATRFYWHPAAAVAIWQANRGLLRDPHVLPIGAALVLPPPSLVAELMRPTDHAAIEPAAEPPLASRPPGAVSLGSWLTAGGVNEAGPPLP